MELRLEFKPSLALKFLWLIFIAAAMLSHILKLATYICVCVYIYIYNTYYIYIHTHTHNSRQAKKCKCNIVFTCYVWKCSPFGWLVGWLVMEILNSQTLTPADICTFADGNLSLAPPPSPVSSTYLIYLLFIFARLTGRKKRLLLYWHIPRSESIISDVLNLLPLSCCMIDSERLEWVSSPLLKDVVKTSTLNE